MNFSTLLFIVSSVVAQNANKDNITQQCASICKSLGANSPTDLKDCSTECFDVVGKMASLGTPRNEAVSSQVSSMESSQVTSVSGMVVSSSVMMSNTMVSMANGASMSYSASFASASSMVKSSQASLSAKAGPTESAKPLSSASKPSSSKSKSGKSDSASNAYFATPSITFLAIAAFVSYL